jgi:hypothetical protein
MKPLQALRDWARALAGGRRQRVLPRRCSKPAIGTRVVLVEGNMRLTVQAGLSDTLWVWLLDAGWRVEPYRPDRRHYTEIARSEVARLIECNPVHRKRLLDQAIRDAEYRSEAGSLTR